MGNQENTLYRVTLENVWGKLSNETAAEIVGIWRALNALPADQDPYHRVKQVVLVARDHNNRIIGLTTAFTSYIQRLQNHFFVFRGLISPTRRIPGLFIKMTMETIKYLEAIHKSHHPRTIGVFAEIENPKLQQIKDAVTVTNLTFIGYSPKGNPIRVYYFKGAKLS
ncbi:MAG: hypothetical protein KI790_20785 [Cyclobacteriaceae bacterium]|nr:hypothetical protein [Cyclobacteriaceae bacterium HetDA_MAG_MS6]